MGHSKSVLTSVTKRFLLLSLGLLIALGITVALAYQYGIHLSNRLPLKSSLPSAADPEKDDSVIIFAPHCDDESIATGGVAHIAKKDGANVKIVVLTNGDGFWMAAGRELHEMRVKPKDYIRFATERQGDTEKAARTLGLAKDDVVFLGYPDRGLRAMWTEHWSPKQPFKSHYTKTVRSPYPNSYRNSALYCGRYLFEDIRSILAENNPTDIYVPHPSDDHPDHAVTYSFVMAALKALQASENSALSGARVHTYLVHRGDWPSPWGWNPKASLRPPFAMSGIDTSWDVCPLTKETILIKKKAIKCHKSQMAIMSRFLLSFARKNELFGTVKTPDIPQVATGVMRVDGWIGDWAGIDPCAKDPTGDKLFRGLEKPGDVKSMYIRADSVNIYLRADFVRRVSRRVTYTVSVRSFGETPNGENTRFWSVKIKPSKRYRLRDHRYAWRSRTLELRIPRSKLGKADRIFVCVDTSTMRLKIDSSGWRGFTLPENDDEL
ncbi:MAG: PIG-L family deacetylase [Armatimonadota bacterium]|nr:PIG-L family deacetylase [Armatimonadota bacterium]